MTGMSRKSNSSSSALAAAQGMTANTTITSGKKARSHVSLANLANDIASAATAASRKAEKDEEEEQHEAVGGGNAMKRTTSKRGAERSQARVKEKEKERAVPTPMAEAEDDGEGWISANSSRAASPDALTKDSPINSPESYKVLEIGKKNRRKAKNGAGSGFPALTFEKQEVARIPTPEIEWREEDDGILGSTPKQGSAGMESHARRAPALAVEGGLSKVVKSERDLQTLLAPREPEREGQQDDEGHLTPLVEKANPLSPAVVAKRALPLSDPAQSSAVPEAKRRDDPPTPTVRSPVRTTAHPPSPQGRDQLPQPPRPQNTKPRLPNLRKASSSTIRSLTSIAGAPATTRASPLTSGIRRSTAPLEPRLDTKTEGLGEILEQNISPTNHMLETPSISVAGDGDRTPGATEVPFPAGADKQGSGIASRRRHGRTISGTSVATFTTQEAEDLARRLRKVSGTDLQAQGRGQAGDAGYFDSYSGARASLRRSASSATAGGLTPLSPNAPTLGGGAFGTLKRASGYFGSITRLASLAGLTSADSSGTSPPSPVNTMRAQRMSPSLSTASPAQAALLQQTSTGGHPPGSQRAGTRGRQTSAPVTSGTGTPGHRHAPAPQQPYRQPPLVSKFINVNHAADGSHALFARQMAAQHRRQQTSSTADVSLSGTGRTASSSRATKKMMTQRDAPYPYTEHADEQQYAGGPPTPGGRSNASSDDEDAARGGHGKYASQVNLRKSLSSGQTTPSSLNPGVTRWIVALVKEAERIDKDFSSQCRWRDDLNASIARVLQKRESEDAAEQRRPEKQ